MYRNRNRGYQGLTVWQDAIKYYVETCAAFRAWSFEFKKVASQQIACADSVHRNIAEGYCRRSIKEYRNFLSFALGSLGESVSGLQAYKAANQISEEDCAKLDSLAYKMENGLLKLVEALELKVLRAGEAESMVKESNAIYQVAETNTPSPQLPSAPSVEYTITPGGLCS